MTKNTEQLNTGTESCPGCSTLSFLSHMAHQMQAPVDSVIGMTGLLIETGLSDEQQQYANAVNASGDALLRIADSILDFSRLATNVIEIEMIDFDLRKLLDDLARSTKLRAEEKGLALDYSVTPEIPAFHSGDPVKLRQILVHLLNNAINLTESGSISIGVDIESETDLNMTLRFSVTDTGIGIPPDRQKILFNRFGHSITSVARKHDRVGLGLPISKHLAEMMGGTIGVISPAKGAQSSEHPGTELWFTARLGRRKPNETHGSEQPGGSNGELQTPLFSPAPRIEALGDDAGMFNEVIRVFLEDAPSQKGQLQQALRSRDKPRSVYSACALKIAAGNVGGRRLETIAHEIETTCSDGDLNTGINTAARLDSELEDLTNELHNWQNLGLSR